MEIRIPTADDPVTIIHGDCLNVLPHIPKGVIDAVVTDPPYGVSYKSGAATGGKWHNARHQGETIHGDDKPFDPTPLLALGVPYILWGANFYSDRLPGCGWLVWDKRHGIEGMQFNRSDSELACISITKTVKTFRHLWHGLCRATEVGSHLHPTQKPVALMEWCINQLHADVSLILDPFGGSGTTAVAAIRLGRRCIIIEREKKYVDIIRKRVDLALGRDKSQLTSMIGAA